MAATQSKTSTKLPKVSNITIGSSVSKRGTTAYTGENGKLGACYVYFKQPSSTKTITGYQVQYKTRSHYTEEYQKKTGTEWTSWKRSPWRNARISESFTSPILGTVPPKGTQEKYPMRKWLKGNRGINKKSRYTKALYLTDHSIGPKYDGRQFKVRIRTFNKSKAIHGDLVYGTVTVWKKTAIVDERAYVAKDGGLDIRFQFKGSDNGTTVVNSIKDSQGRELIKSQYKGSEVKWKYDNYSDLSVRSGYTPAQILIEGSKLNRLIEYGETLTCDIVYTNEHKAPTKFALTKVKAMDTSLKEGITVTMETNADLGCVVVKVNDSQAAYDDIDFVDSLMFYKDKYGNTNILDPFAQETVTDGSKTTIGTFYYLAPYNTELDARVMLHSRYGSSCSVTYKITDTFKSGKYTLVRQWVDVEDIEAVNSWFEAIKSMQEEDMYKYMQIAAAYDSVEMSVTSNLENIYLSPLGEKVSWGDTNGAAPITNISFTANVIDKSSEDLACQKTLWDDMRKGIGSYFTLRTPYGEVYNVLMDSFSITKTAPYVYTVAFEATEVSNFYIFEQSLAI